jgi:hypothetical protein
METAAQFAHKANMARYQKILATYLTAEELKRWREHMIRLVLACATLLFLIGNALAQVESNHCVWLRNQIALTQRNINGLRALLSTASNLAVLTCVQNQGELFDRFQARCNATPDSYGTWFDAETRTTYVIFTAQWIADYALNRGVMPWDLKEVVNRNEAVKAKINYGGVIPSMEAQLVKMMSDYQHQCAQPPQRDPRVRRPLPIPDGGLLGVPGVGGPTGR